MKSSIHNIIEDLWHGNVDPLNGELFKSPEMKKLIELIARNRENLEKTLNAEEKQLLEKYSDCNSEFNGLSELSIFQCGFKLGAKIIISILVE